MSIIVFALCLISTSMSFTIKNLKEPFLFKNEICSYNGEPHEYYEPNQPIPTIYCLCKREFANITSLNRQINGAPIQCSYERKRRLLTLLFAICLPIGIDYLYLEKYFVFIIIFILVMVMVIGNCLMFAKAELEKNKEADELNRNKNKRNYLFVFFRVLMVVCFVLWLADIIVMSTGFVNDYNGVETVDDIREIFEYIFTK